MKSNVLIWRSVYFTGHEFSRLSFKASKWNLQGTAILMYKNIPCKIDYSILCNSSWQTLSANVNGWLGNKEINCNIYVDKKKQWFLNKKVCHEVFGCTDIDLNFSPSTNLLPIRRLKLAKGETGKIKAAWLRFPTFKLELLEQSYYKINKDTYMYESGNGKFMRDIKVNRSGIVINYPDFWEAEN